MCVKLRDYVMEVHKWVMVQGGEAGYKIPMKLLSVNVLRDANVEFECSQGCIRFI